jgi:hypothetical protein
VQLHKQEKDVKELEFKIYNLFKKKMKFTNLRQNLIGIINIIIIKKGLYWMCHVQEQVL